MTFHLPDGHRKATIKQKNRTRKERNKHGICNTGIPSSGLQPPKFMQAPDAAYQAVDQDGVAPDYFHSTSMYPEYFKINGTWVLAEESRMDSSVVICDDGHLEVVENRNLKG